MVFYNQTWFWTGAFAVIASLGTVFIKELISSRSAIKLERLKLYESEQFRAFEKLYGFISSTYDCLWPPEHSYAAFNALMKRRYVQEIKPLLLYFSSDIRKQLNLIESQHECMGDDDLIPPFKQKDFFDSELSKILQYLSKEVENHTSKIL
ncbi:MAG: hypothetical protein HQ557_15760 [Bacteroidetes bacterium]|nr:hypothetical protein [Bacteroidota bacterium]